MSTTTETTTNVTETTTPKGATRYVCVPCARTYGMRETAETCCPTPAEAAMRDLSAEELRAELRETIDALTHARAQLADARRDADTQERRADALRVELGVTDRELTQTREELTAEKERADRLAREAALTHEFSAEIRKLRDTVASLRRVNDNANRMLREAQAALTA